jgi:hypothetical protein
MTTSGARSSTSAVGTSSNSPGYQVILVTAATNSPINWRKPPREEMTS